MIRCTVLLFAHLRQAMGRDRLSIELEDNVTVAHVLKRLSEQHEAVASMRDRVAVAVNERYVGPDHVLRDGDVIAMIPPVSGG